MKGVYENRLEAAIIDLRDQQAADLDQMKDDLEDQYSAKVGKVDAVTGFPKVYLFC